MMWNKPISRNLFKASHNGIVLQCNSSTNAAKKSEFIRLELIPKQQPRFTRKAKGVIKTEISQPRYKQMPIDQKWSDVWPTAQSFRPSVVPLPLFQGFVTQKHKAAPDKFSNAELMKIPNFLHLTPPAIDEHCEALKKFCTPWPKALKTDEDVKKHFPVEVISADWIYTGPSLREPRARVVTLKFQLSDLKLDYRARDKFLRLVGEKYNPKTNTVTIEADRCPLRKQNYDYAIYVITALYHESKMKEDWEDEKTEDDMEAFFFEKSRSQKKVQNTIQVVHGLNEEDASQSTFVVKYGEALEKLLNESESEENLEEFKLRALDILGLKENSQLKKSSEE